MSVDRRSFVTTVIGLASAAVAGSVVAGCAPDQPVSPGSRPPTPAGSGTSSGTGTSSGSATPAVSPSSTAPAVTVTSNLAATADQVPVDTVLQIEAEQGTISQVSARATVVDAQGASREVSVPGTLNQNRTSWQATEGLDPGARYTLKVTAADLAGTPTTWEQTFTTRTLSLKQRTFPSIFPLDQMKVGIAMAAIISFDLPVEKARRAAVQKQLKVTTTPAQEGSWYWLSDTEVHYRPKTYWKPGTKVSVDARLNGVRAGKDLYCQRSRQWSFTVGRAVISRTDLATRVTKVYVDGKLARTIAISAGKSGFITRSGTKVIMEKLRRTPMASETQNVSDPDYYNLSNVEYALRLTSSGEFFHAAPWNAANFGRVNASHGCTGMSLADAAWLFQATSVGDPAEFTGSKRPMELGNGYTDWDLTWQQVKQRSAS